MFGTIRSKLTRIERLVEKHEKIKKRDSMQVSWTSWYCPVKRCKKIVYNKSFGDRYAVSEHLFTHGLDEAK